MDSETLELLTTAGRARLAELVDFEDFARYTNTKLSMVAAVYFVESGGKPFYKDGRPTALGERATFFQKLPVAKRKDAVAQGLAVPKWSRKYQKQLYGDQKNADGVYNCIKSMIEFHPIAGWQSFSIGGAQVMTFNAKLVGFDGPKDMLRKFRDDERHHLLAMLRYVQAAGLVDEMQRLDFLGFAQGYNGLGQAPAYARKLRRWQRHWARKLGE